MVRHCDKIIEFLIKSSVFVLVFILLGEIESFKSIIRNILIFAENHNKLLRLEFSDISQLYILLRKWALYYLVFCIIIFLLIKIYLLVRYHFNSPKNIKLNPFEDSLYKYIEQKPNGKGYLVTGEWGSGKTYIISRFLNKYYKYSNKPIYRISCFGLDSRQLVLEEIKNQIEINDKSFLNWIQYIPALGKPLYSILKDSYSLKSIPKRSIFIFDDFERITSLGITNSQKHSTYEKDKFILRNRDFSRDSQTKEFEDINKEFKKIEEAFRRFSRENEMISLTDNLQRYNIVTGLINELIESYNLKVIIICNVDILGYDYVDKVFRGKLDCITYNKSIDENSIKSIFRNTSENQIYSKKDVKELVERVSYDIIRNFEKVWFLSGNSNLRQAKSVVQAFLDTVNIISPKVTLNENYLLSLFFSIYVVRVLRDENRLENLEQFLVGGNLAFFLHLYEKNNLYKSLTLIDDFNKLKWTGISVSGFWILNMEKPENINDLVKIFENYDYNDLELTLLQHGNFGLNGDKLLIEHVMYVARKESRTDTPDKQLEEISQKVRSNFGSILAGNSNVAESMEENVKKLLIKTDNILGGGYYRFLEKWYESIYLYSKVESVIEEGNIITLRQYNEFVQKSKNEAESESL